MSLITECINVHHLLMLLCDKLPISICAQKHCNFFLYHFHYYLKTQETDFLFWAVMISKVDQLFFFLTFGFCFCYLSFSFSLIFACDHY